MDSLFRDFGNLDIGDYIIRNIENDDYEDIYSLYGDAEVMKYNMMHLLKSLDNAKDNIKLIKKAISNKWFVRVGVINKEDNEFIGTIAFHHFEFDNKKLQIGYNLKKAYWGKGIMSEVLSSIIDYLKSNTSLEVIDASIDKDNIASIKLVEKLGFELSRRDENWLIYTKNLI